MKVIFDNLVDVKTGKPVSLEAQQSQIEGMTAVRKAAKRAAERFWARINSDDGKEY